MATSAEILIEGQLSQNIFVREKGQRANFCLGVRSQFITEVFLDIYMMENVEIKKKYRLFFLP